MKLRKFYNMLTKNKGSCSSISCFNCPKWDGSACGFGDTTFTASTFQKRIKEAEEWLKANPKIKIKPTNYYILGNGAIVHCLKYLPHSLFPATDYFYAYPVYKENKFSTGIAGYYAKVAVVKKLSPQEYQDFYDEHKNLILKKEDTTTPGKFYTDKQTKTKIIYCIESPTDTNPNSFYGIDLTPERDELLQAIDRVLPGWFNSTCFEELSISFTKEP